MKRTDFYMIKGNKMAPRLYKSRKSKMIGGVAGGLGDYFDIDPVIVRVLFIITAFAWGVSIIAYILMWIILPENPDELEYYYEFTGEKPENLSEEYGEDTNKKKSDRKIIAGIFLIGFGLIIFIDKVTDWIQFKYVWPLILVVIGASLVYGSYKRKSGGSIL